MENRNDSVQESAAEWQAPPPPVIPSKEEPPQMSEAATLGNIFFEPGATFEDLRRKPRFLLALLLIVVAISTYTFLFFQKMGDDRIRRSVVEQMDKNPTLQSLPLEQKQRQIEISMSVSRYVRYAIPIFIVIGFAVGSLIYWLAGKAMGGTGNFWHAAAIFVYSGFPPTLIAMLANLLVLFLKSVDDIDISASQRGLIQANPSFFLDGKTMPVLATLLGTLDLFMIWGWILAAVGFQKIMKLSKESSWAIVLILALLGLTYRIVSAYFSGNPM